MKNDAVADCLAQYREYLIRHKVQLLRERQEEQKEEAKPPEHVPLLDQLRALLATWPTTQTARISLPILLPHLKGKYRDLPNHAHVARCLKILGYRNTRSWSKEDAGCRYWVKV